LIAAGMVIAMVATCFLRDNSWPRVQWGTFVVDSIYLAMLLLIAFWTNKYWSLAAASIQLVAVATHVVKMVDPRMDQRAYITTGVIWTYALMIAMSTGVWNCSPGCYPATILRAPATATRR
jgi:hypothetical protein